jgi:phage/plasmid-like protein (TIGR03299 family)
MTNFATSTPWGNNAAEIKTSFTSVEDVMQESGLNYHVGLQDCFLANGVKVPKTKITVREDNGSVMGTVGDRYTPLQNRDAFAWFQDFIDAKVATIEHAGSLKKGQLVFIQAKINAPPVEIVKGDEVQSYITMLNSFNGSTSVFAGFFPRRIFCQNQLPALKASKMLKLKHTKNLHVGMEKIAEIMDVQNQEFIATTEQYKYLASVGVNPKDIEKYVKLVFGKGADDETEIRVNRIDEITEAFESGLGQSGATRNYYGLFNALNETLNYTAGRSVDSRLSSLWMGVNAQVNQKALDVALEMSAGRL